MAKVPMKLLPILDAWSVGEEHRPTFVMQVKHCNRAKAVEYINELVASGHLMRPDTRDAWKRVA